MLKTFICAILMVIFSAGTYSQTATIQVNALSGRKIISPALYGKNNSLSDNSGSPLSAATWQKFKDAGLRMFRENGGNNATKYNWRKKISSHPDWYNNVYAHNWDYASQSLQANMSGVNCMWAFQLIGKVAANTSNNFNDWAYNSSQWWSGCGQNLAGGGVVNPAGGSNALTNGNPDLYLLNWTADSTVGILNKWFGVGGLGLNKAIFKYWNMDNEPEIWNGTHDDVMPTQLSAEDFMQRYFATAKKARAAFPEIKLCGPVVCNEWQWYNWDGNLIYYNGKNYTWLEYFIKRIAEEQVSSGIRLLDVLDIHFYPGESATSDVLQLHRVFFDKSYNYPGANGIKKINGGWDNSQTKEYIFERCNSWLNTHIGANHGVTLGLSEMDINNSTPSIVSNWYASMLGTFADNGVEVFTPWSWKTGMWETLHLFSRYAKNIRVQSTSSIEQYVSAYSSLSNDFDSLTIILVNRSESSTYNTTVNLTNFSANDGNYDTKTLSGLTASETFVSHTQNALVSSTVSLSGNSFSISVPPLSIKAVLLAGSSPSSVIENPNRNNLIISYIDNENIKIDYTVSEKSWVQLEVFDLQGKKIQTMENAQKTAGTYSKNLEGTKASKGIYIIKFKANNTVISRKIIVK